MEERTLKVSLTTAKEYSLTFFNGITLHKSGVIPLYVCNE